MLYFSDVSDVLLQSIFKLNDDEKLSYKYYNKRITTRDNGKVQFHDKEESKLNSTITANSGAHKCMLQFTLPLSRVVIRLL